MELTPHEALIYIMALAAAADRQVQNNEIEGFATLLNVWPVFEGFDTAELPEITAKCVSLLNAGGIDPLLSSIADALSPKLQETAYALAVEIATIDLRLEQEELRFLEMLRDSFEIDRLVTAAIETAARIRHRKLPRDPLDWI